MHVYGKRMGDSKLSSYLHGVRDLRCLLNKLRELGPSGLLLKRKIRSWFHFYKLCIVIFFLHTVVSLNVFLTEEPWF